VKVEMMEKKVRSAIFVVLIVLTLAACQAQATPTPAGGDFGGNGTPGGRNFQNNPDFLTRVAGSPDMQTRIASGQGPSGGQGGFGRSTATPTLMPTVVEVPTETPTVISPTAPAEQAVQDYFAALASGDMSGASRLLSAFSLMQAKTTAGSVADQLAEQKLKGAAWSGLQIKDSQVFNDNTVLVHVQYQLAGAPAQGTVTPAPTATTAPAGQASTVTPGSPSPTQMDEVWPVRLEAGKWLVNWDKVIDFETLTAPVQQAYGLTIDPLKVTRYSDHLTLTLLVQNATNEAIVIGQVNQILATFHFGDQAVDAVNTRYIIDSMRSYSNIEITVPGLFNSYPDSVDLVKFKSFPNQKPWFTIKLSS
jgi:hypothetical protein